jgi:hypothetical protein
VVTDGADRLRDGAKVSIPDTPSAPPAAGEGHRGPGGRHTGNAQNGDRSGSHDHGNWQHRKHPQQDDSNKPKPGDAAAGGSPPSGN